MIVYLANGLRGLQPRALNQRSVLPLLALALLGIAGALLVSAVLETNGLLLGLGAIGAYAAVSLFKASFQS